MRLLIYTISFFEDRCSHPIMSLTSFSLTLSFAIPVPFLIRFMGHVLPYPESVSHGTCTPYICHYLEHILAVLRILRVKLTIR
jgi:hypothetical protein